MKKITALVVTVVLTVVFASMGLAINKDVEFEGGGKGKVVFKHKTHTEGDNKMACNKCHTDIFQRKAGGTEGITMAAMEEGKFCGACHTNDHATLSVKNPEHCTKCHME